MTLARNFASRTLQNSKQNLLKTIGRTTHSQAPVLAMTGKHQILTDFFPTLSFSDHYSFLDEVDRVADPEYVPTDDDILQARVRTLAVSEHIFDIDGVAYRYGVLFTFSLM